MSRNLMPKSGAMAPYLVMNRDAAVAGVFSVDGEAGSVNLTTKYVQITAYNTRVGAVEQKVTTLEGQVVSINQSISDLNTAVGANTQAIAGKASKGSNSDITEITGLTTALSVSQGGTGAKDVEGAKVNLGVDKLVQTPSHTYIASPAGSKLIVGDGGVVELQNDSGDLVGLPLSAGGTGGTNASEAKTNLGLDRFGQVGNVTAMTSGDKTKSIIVDNAGNWGGYNETSQAYIPLAIGMGGTGGWDTASARANLQLDRLEQGNIYTSLFSSNKLAQLTVRDDGLWGMFVSGEGANRGWNALKIEQGGTGGLTPLAARNNLQLGEQNDVVFRHARALSFTGVGGAWTPVIKKMKDQQTPDVNRNNQLSYVENSDCAVTNYIITVDGVAQYVWQLTRSDNVTGWYSMRADNTMHTPLGQVAIQGSDVRIKDNFEPAKSGAWDRISQIGICEFTYKGNSVPQRGYLAQQMGDVDPLYVFNGGTSESEDGETFDILNVNDKAVVADLITVVQELQMIVAEQKVQIAELQARK